jgi:hypothetical protein
MAALGAVNIPALFSKSAYQSIGFYLGQLRHAIRTTRCDYSTDRSKQRHWQPELRQAPGPAAQGAGGKVSVHFAKHFWQRPREEFVQT